MPKRPHTTCLLTFDYELFHGRNYSHPGDVLFEPTAQILQLCERLRVPVTLFPDVCSAWWHREHGREGYVERFERQLRRAHDYGHDVQLHLHPHWLRAEPRGDAWSVDESRMLLHEFGWGEDEGNAPAIIRRGVRYLEDLLAATNPSYRCIGFRAAGLALQPEEGQLLEALIAAGIRADCSVVRRVYSGAGTSSLDYRRVPQRANWRMSPESGLLEARHGLLEIPIGTFRASRRQRLAFLARRARAFRARRGEPIARREHQSRTASLRQVAQMNLRYLAEDPWFTLSCDTKGFSLKMILDGLESVIDEHRGEDKIAVCLISHPKLMFGPQLEMLRGFIVGARRRFAGKFSFGTVSSVVREFDGAHPSATMEDLGV